MYREINCYMVGTALHADIGCEIDDHTVRRIREQIDTYAFTYKPKVIIIDFSSVPFMDSSGIGMIYGRCDVARDIGAYVKLVGMNPLIKRLLRLSGAVKIANLSFGNG